MKDIATTSMSVFRNLDCLSLVVCSNTTLLKLQNVLFLLFSKFCASKSGVRLIYGCGLYTDVYGTLATKLFQFASCKELYSILASWMAFSVPARAIMYGPHARIFSIVLGHYNNDNYHNYFLSYKLNRCYKYYC